MRGLQFGSLPNWWFRDKSLLSNLRSDDTGTGIAAMKCLIALSVLIDFHSRDTDSSLSDLETITGLSRPMVVRGINRLQKQGVIEVDKTNYKNNYKLLVVSGDNRWAKVPVDKVRKELKLISNRGIAPFSALKIYITLLSLRYQDKIHVKITHETLRDYTKVQPNQIRSGLDVLFSNSMIHLMPKDEQTSNEYKLLGL